MSSPIPTQWDFYRVKIAECKPKRRVKCEGFECYGNNECSSNAPRTPISTIAFRFMIDHKCYCQLMLLFVSWYLLSWFADSICCFKRWKLSNSFIQKVKLEILCGPKHLSSSFILKTESEWKSSSKFSSFSLIALLLAVIFSIP